MGYICHFNGLELKMACILTGYILVSLKILRKAQTLCDNEREKMWSECAKVIQAHNQSYCARTSAQIYLSQFLTHVKLLVAFVTRTCVQVLFTF